MSESILNLIFKGNLLPWEGKVISTPKMKVLNKKIEEEREHFEDQMTTHEKNRFDGYNCLLTNRNNEENSSEQFDNFMLGIMIGIEIIEHKQGLNDE